MRDYRCQVILSKLRCQSKFMGHVSSTCVYNLFMLWLLWKFCLFVIGITRGNVSRKTVQGPVQFKAMGTAGT